QALISKFESGTRKPTKDQISKLSQLLEIDYETLMIAWLKEKILYEIGDDEFALKALMVAEHEIKYNRTVSKLKISATLENLLKEIDLLKAKLDSYRQFDSYR
ncbi:DNA-binding protein, partial [Massilia sp. CCM 8734]|nr:DNA-binding protein [Massilia sp. CCM 8734]